MSFHATTSNHSLHCIHVKSRHLLYVRPSKKMRERNIGTGAASDSFNVLDMVYNYKPSEGFTLRFDLN